MNACEIEIKVAEYAKEHNLCAKDDAVIVALSGGADSVALLRVLFTIGVQCCALHCNYGLRGAESDRDEAFVRNLCTQLGVLLKVKHFDVAKYEQEQKVSTEMACRELRYAWFDEERALQGAKAIVVAHHYDDNVETFFLNMLRGTGIQGLTGIRAKNGYVVRPLLCVKREEIEAYLKELGQEYVVDSTNLENDFKRNKIRNVLIPTLNELFPDYEAGMMRTLQNLQGCNDFYQSAVEELRVKAVDKTQNDVVRVVLDHISSITAGRETAIFELIKDYGFNSQDAERINKCLDEDCTETRTFLSHKCEAHLKNSFLDIYPIRNEVADVKCLNVNDLLEQGNDDSELVASIETKAKGQKMIPGIDGRKTIALNVDILKENPLLIVRGWKQGDRISPYGMKGSKLVSDLFADNKFTSYQKHSARVVALASEEGCEGEVIWVLNLRASRHYAVGVNDESYLKLSIRE